MTAEPFLTIGQLAERTGFGVGVETIRYYERKGLLDEPPRTPAGYRQYPPGTVDRLRFVRRAQALGFTLDEIGDLLELRVDEVAACPSVEESARTKLELVKSKIRELRRIRRSLEHLLRACRAREPTSECPILEALGE